MHQPKLHALHDHSITPYCTILRNFNTNVYTYAHNCTQYSVHFYLFSHIICSLLFDLYGTNINFFLFYSKELITLEYVKKIIRTLYLCKLFQLFIYSLEEYANLLDCNLFIYLFEISMLIFIKLFLYFLIYKKYVKLDFYLIINRLSLK